MAGLLFCAALFIAVAVLLFAQSTDFPPYHQQGRSTDSGVFQYVARVIARGGMPYRDVFDHKGPLLYIINYAALLLGGWGIFAVNILALVFGMGLAWLGLRDIFGSQLGRAAAGFCAAGVFFGLQPYYEGGNLAETYALPLLCLGQWMLLRYYKNNGSRWFEPLLAGLSLGGVLLLRANMAGLYIGLCACMGIRMLRKKQWKDLRRYLLLVPGGMAATFLPFLLWLWRGGALRDFLAQYGSFNAQYTGQFHVWGVLRGAVKVSLSPLLCLAGAFLLLALAHRFLTRRERAAQRDAGYLIPLAVSFAVQAVLANISGMNFLHYNQVLIPCALVPLGMIAARLTTWVRGQGGRPVLAALAVGAIMVTPQTPMLVMAVNNVVTYCSVGYIPWGPAVSDPKEYSALIAAVQAAAAPDEPILVIGNACGIYNSAGRFAASKYAYQFPLWEVDRSIELQVLEDIRATRPKMIVQAKSVFQEPEWYEGHALDQYIHSEYILSQTIGGIDLWLRGDLAASTGQEAAE
jgi:hypothetical protein